MGTTPHRSKLIALGLVAAITMIGETPSGQPKNTKKVTAGYVVGYLSTIGIDISRERAKTHLQNHGLDPDRWLVALETDLRYEKVRYVPRAA